MSVINREKLESLGLSYDEVSKHQAHLKSATEKAGDNFIPVADSCTLENGGIVDLNKVKGLSDISSSGFLGFIPSAGAASRYFQCLRPLEKALVEGDLSKVESELNKLLEEGASKWALPKPIHLALQGGASYALDKKNDIIESLAHAKALQPCVLTGESFLSLKDWEHSKLSGMEAQVFVTPYGKVSDFQGELPKPSIPCKFYEQGPDLSTIRFNMQAEPYTDSTGAYSVVPAGHGTLVKLFPKVKKDFPKSHSVLIRNIDNVNGTSRDIIDQTDLFMKAHQWVLSHLVGIRKALKEDKYNEASAIAAEVLEQFPKSPKQFSPENYPEELRTLFKLQTELFHFSDGAKVDNPHELVKTLYKRPFNTMGQVPNSGKDVGGTPVYADISGSKPVICLEVPHASPEDKKHFFEDSQKATHFNPVFVAAEIVDDVSGYQDNTSPFWILAKKNFAHTDVMYYETVLYELLGNSIMANVMFPAIPRNLFNPHKTVKDTENRSMEMWSK